MTDPAPHTTTPPSRRPLYGLIGAYLVSGIGTAMSQLAIPWLVLIMTGSAASTGLVGFAQMTPYVLLQATAGPLVDRIGQRRAFLLGNSAAAVAVCAIPLIHQIGGLSVGALAGLGAVAGAVRGVADCATAPLLPITAELGGVAYERAAGLFSSANRAAMLAGMPLAGVLVAVIGAAQVVLIDGVSFALAVLILAAMLPASVGRSNPSAGAMRLRQYLVELAEGLRFLRGDRLLLGIVTMVAVTNLLDEALTGVLLPVWAHDRAHHVAAIGLIGGSWGLGMLLGALGGAWLAARLPRWQTLAVGLLLSSSPPFFALAASTSLPLLLPLWLLCGVLGGVLNPILGAVQFERVPARLQARVLGAIKASAWVGVPFGSLVGGALAQGPGLTAALLSCGSLMLLATFAPLVFPAWRGLERREAALV
ncbi:MAG TPA: MFS transporter [Jatrophihabitans sp.]|nr:MFS transporter [Jatrophihabitans sp.]